MTDWDTIWMRRAIELAKTGQAKFGDRPFGCVVVDQYQDEIGCGWGTETPWDPTRHCEITAIRMACTARQDAHLHGTTLYTTHEPCTMCCGAIIHALITRVVWGSERRDLPQLFHRRRVSAEDLLADTSNGRITVARAAIPECMRLFDAEVAEAMVR